MKELYSSIEIDAPVERVWTVLTDLLVPLFASSFDEHTLAGFHAMNAAPQSAGRDCRLGLRSNANSCYPLGLVQMKQLREPVS